MNLEQMKRDHEACIGRMKAVLDKAEREGRSDLTEEEARNYNFLETEADRLRVKIEEAEERADRPYLPDFHAKGKPRDLRELGGIIGDPKRALLGDGPYDDMGFRGWHDYLKTILLESGSQRAQSTLAGEAGGFATPQILYAGILDALRMKSFAYANSWIIPMGDGQGNTLELSMWDSFDQSSGARIAGLKGVWLAEDQAASEQEAVLRLLKIGVHKNAVYGSHTREFGADSIISAQRIANALAVAIAASIDLAIVRGSGIAPTPLGVLNDPALIQVVRTTANTVEYDDLATMVSRLHPECMPTAIWVVSPSALRALLLMEDGSNSIIWMPGQIAGARPQSIMGLPVYVSDVASALGDAADVLLLDLSKYAIVQRGQLIFETSSSVHWTRDRIAFRSIQRVGGHGLWPEPIQPMHGGETLSPFVILR